MSAVTVQEVIERLEGLGNPKALDLIKRISTHGIAPPEGMALVPNWETEFCAEREKFKNETLRASKLHALVQKFVTQHGEGYHTGKLGSNGCGICALVEEAKAMLPAAPKQESE